MVGKRFEVFAKFFKNSTPPVKLNYRSFLSCLKISKKKNPERNKRFEWEFSNKLN